LEYDGEEHALWRGLMAELLTPAAVRELEPMVTEIVNARSTRVHGYRQPSRGTRTLRPRDQCCVTTTPDRPHRNSWRHMRRRRRMRGVRMSRRQNVTRFVEAILQPVGCVHGAGPPQATGGRHEAGGCAQTVRLRRRKVFS
jgi:hypothetical protein